MWVVTCAYLPGFRGCGVGLNTFGPSYAATYQPDTRMVIFNILETSIKGILASLGGSVKDSLIRVDSIVKQLNSNRLINSSLVSEIWMNFKPLIAAITGIFGTILGIASAYEILLSANTYYISALIVFFACYTLALLAALSYSIFIATRRSLRQRVVLNREGWIEAIEGDYLSTVEYVTEILNKKDIPLDQLYCVVGINQAAELSNSSEGSVLEGILKRLVGEQKGSPSTDEIDLQDPDAKKVICEFQDEVNQALEHLDDEAFEHPPNESDQQSLLAFGSCFCVDLPFGKRTGVPSPRILFVANSMFDSEAAKSTDSYNSITGPASIDVIPNVFATVRRLKIQHLIVPALGTYRLGNSSQTVIGGIVLRYLSTMRAVDRPFNMTITLRRSDLECSKTNLSQIKQYIRHATELFN